MSAAVVIWIWFCAYLNAAGWALSAIHQLNAGGYAVALLVWLAALFVWRKKSGAQFLPQIRWRKIRRRFRRAFPLAFLVLAALAFLGGVLYPPTNYDALAYRIPRILHWLAEGRWHWIHTVFDRVNDRSCGIEWVSAPVIALLKTDRPLFLINSISLLLLPGLVFSTFTRLGVRRRVAWHWMWIVPTGYGYLLQAGSIGNDLFGAPFALAAVDFALRARTSRSPGDFFASILAAAMMTSAKTATLPLLLPWAVAIFPSLQLILRRPLATFAVCIIAVAASALPTVVLNQHFYGDWSGSRLGNGNVKYAAVLKAGANPVLFATENFVPPVFPLAGKWNRAVEQHLPPRLEEKLAQIIENPGCKFELQEMQIEENAGLGFGISVLLLASFIAAMVAPGKKSSGPSAWQACVRWSPLISLGTVLAVSNVTALARILVPYYALLIPILLIHPGQSPLLKKSWWRAAAGVVFIIAAGLLVVSPARPLFPIQTILAKSKNPPARIREVYSVYHERNDAFAPVRDILPPDLKTLGMITFDDPETSLWRPFGTRRIVHVCPEDSPADLKQRGVEYVLIKTGVLQNWFHLSPDDWCKQMNAQVVQIIPLNLRASAGPLDWYLVKLN